MNIMKVFILFIGTTFGTNAIAATPSQCDNVLLTKNISKIKESSDLFSAWLSLIDESNYSSVKQDASANAPGYFSGDYHDFKQKRTTYLNGQKSSFSSSRAKEVLSISLPDNAISAWRSCVSGNSSGLFAFSVRGTEQSVDIVVGWRHPPGLSNPDRIDVTVNGQRLNVSFPANFEGEKTITIPRPSGEINGNVNATIAGAGYTTTFHVPAYAVPIPPLLCGTNSRRIYASNSNGATAQLKIPPSECDRTIIIGGVAGATLKEYGDPWVRVYLDQGDGSAPAQAQEYVAEKGTTFAKVNREIFLRKGEERQITVKHENFRALANETTAWADVPTP